MKPRVNQGHIHDSDADFASDANLSPAIQYSTVTDLKLASPGVALLTGATGFLGANLLRDLLIYTSLDVVCLVRASDQASAGIRLRRTLEQQQLWSDKFAPRIRTLVGDMSEPRLGLSQADFVSLGREVGLIYHCAAQINLLFPYRALRSVNVKATHEMLRLAAIAPPKSFHHISTLAVFGRTIWHRAAEIPEAFRVQNSPEGASGYAESKWVAEQLVNTAADRGLFVSIYRPGLIAGHSATGVCNIRDGYSLILRTCIQLGVAPESYDDVYMTPVDIVSRTIVDLSRGRYADGRAFHIINPSPVLWAEVTAALSGCGYVRSIVPYDEWRRCLRRRVQETSNKALECMLAILPDVPPCKRKLPHQPLQRIAEQVGDRPKLRGPDAEPDISGSTENAALLRLYLSYISRIAMREADDEG
jgi:thioester reductase-like protein